MQRGPFDWRWLYGGPWDIWINRAGLIGSIIRDQKLKAVPVEDLPVHPGAVEVPEAVAKTALRVRPFPGGIRGPHLHFQGEVYLLSQEQWTKFSSAVLEQYREKLGRAGHVGFDGLMDIAGAIEPL